MRRLAALLVCLVVGCIGCARSNKGQTGKIIDPKTTESATTEDLNREEEMQQLIQEDLEESRTAFSELNPVFFDYDRWEIRGDQTAALEDDARWMRAHPEARVLIEGHCDERGTDEYNLALGDQRARVARDYLLSLGIEGRRFSTVTYGESRPFAKGHEESAWSQNRRAHFVEKEP